MTLTRRQREIWEYLDAYTAAHGYAPTLEEIGAHFGLSSLATVHKHLSNLERKGVVARKWNLSRAIELLKPIPRTELARSVSLPLLGRVAAGVPLEAVENQDEFSVPADLVRHPHATFVLRVEGESMRDQGILDGDYVIVERKSTADNGETVVAVVDGEATVKQLVREGRGLIRLQPANSEMQPIYAAGKDVEIRGTVVGLIRKYA